MNGFLHDSLLDHAPLQAVQQKLLVLGVFGLDVGLNVLEVFQWLALHRCVDLCVHLGFLLVKMLDKVLVLFFQHHLLPEPKLRDLSIFEVFFLSCELNQGHLGRIRLSATEVLDLSEAAVVGLAKKAWANLAKHLFLGLRGKQVPVNLSVSPVVVFVEGMKHHFFDEWADFFCFVKCGFDFAVLDELGHQVSE